jgi:hypothetical protein
MATTVKTFVTNANHGETESTYPYDELATFCGTDATKVQVTVTHLGGDRVFIVASKTVA